MPTVGVSPGTFTIALGACPQDPKGWYMTNPLEPISMVDTTPHGGVTLSPYATEAALQGLRGRSMFGLRTDIFGVVLGGVLVVGLTIGLLASK